MEPIADLAQLGHLSDRTEYLGAAGELLLEMFPADSVGRIAVDPAAGTAEALVYPEHQRAAVPGGWRELWEDHPILLSCMRDTAAGMWRPRRLSDLVTDRELYATRAYRVGLSALGSNRQLSFLTARNGRTGIQGWSLNRWGHDFTNREVELSGYLQPILRLLDAAYEDNGHEDEQKNAAAAYSLTAREQEVLRLVGRGLTATAIGHMLGISPRTASKHLENAYAKLGCNNRIDALRRFTGR